MTTGLAPQIEVEHQMAIGACQYPIVVDVWKERIDTLTESVPMKRGDIICVEDLKGDGSEFGVQTIPGLGGMLNPLRINSLRREGRCKLAITT